MAEGKLTDVEEATFGLLCAALPVDDGVKRLLADGLPSSGVRVQPSVGGERGSGEGDLSEQDRKGRRRACAKEKRDRRSATLREHEQARRTRATRGQAGVG